MKKFLCFLLFIVVFANCERDDICDDGKVTTPRIYIAFYNIESPNEDVTKSVTDFRIVGVGPETVFEDYDGTTDAQEILLPLKTTENFTQFRLIKGYSYDDNDTPDDETDDIYGGNEDIITISYNLETEYVSRACGYRTYFTDVDITVEDDGDKWIQLSEPTSNNLTVSDELNIHYKFYH